MDITINKINFIKATDNLKLVGLNILSDDVSSDVTYILNDEYNDDAMNNTKMVNMLCLRDLSGNVIHNIYDSKVPFFKSATYSVGKSQRVGSTNDFNNSFLHEDNTRLTKSIQVDNTLYSLIPPSIYGHSTLSVDSNVYLAQENGNVTLPNNQIETYLYDKSVISAVVMGLKKPTELSANEEVLRKLYNIKYSTICEMPGNVENDFASGNIAANTYKTKNQYDSQYDMAHTTSNNLVASRHYYQIDNCNNQIYLKYSDNVNYNVDHSTGISTFLTPTEDAGFGKYGYTLQNIEMIHSINRTATPSGHRSNLYSIKIDTDMLKSSALSAIKDILENEIKTNVRDITKKLSPGQTQLFDVYL